MANFYTVKETAQILGLSTNTVYKYLEQGRLKGARGSIKQGRFRIPRSEIDSFLVDQPVGQAEPELNQASPQLVKGALPLLPIKVTRVLLVISLLLIISYLFFSDNFSLTEQAFRLVIISIFILLTYQFISQ